MRLKTKLASMLAVAMVLVVTAVTAPAALAATGGGYTCKFHGTTYTITADQYAQLVQLYGQKAVDAHCQPL